MTHRLEKAPMIVWQQLEKLCDIKHSQNGRFPKTFIDFRFKMNQLVTNEQKGHLSASSRWWVGSECDCK